MRMARRGDLHFRKISDFWIGSTIFFGQRNMKFGLKWVHMARCEFILRLDGALWLRIILKPLLTPKRALESSKIRKKNTKYSRAGQVFIFWVSGIPNFQIQVPRFPKSSPRRAGRGPWAGWAWHVRPRHGVARDCPRIGCVLKYPSRLQPLVQLFVTHWFR